jgi:capsular polysaccharide biosynthesis protein
VRPHDTSRHQVAANRCKLTRPRQSARPKLDRNSALSQVTRLFRPSTSETLGRIIRMDYPHCNLFIIPDRGFILQAWDDFQPPPISRSRLVAAAAWSTTLEPGTPRMTAQLKIKENEATLLRAYYEEVARDTLGILWHQKLLIVGILLAALLFASIFLVLIGPRYTGEATIHLNFTREEPKIQPIASIDAVALVDGAIRVIRSRATASAVVARLGLDKDPEFARESNVWRVFSIVRTGFGLAAVEPSQRDFAVNELMRKITVASETRSYLISVATTAGDPERAARLANAVALEYLRGQMLQQLADTQAAAERELTQLSSVYGVRHPSYVLARTRLDTLQNRLTALRDGPPDDDTVRLVIGQSFVAAEKTFVPSGPHIILILGLTAGAALGVGIWLALRLAPRRQPRPDKLAIVGDRAG